MGGTPVTESYFTANDAKTIASEALIKSKSNFETGVYGFVGRGPVSSNYETNATSNSINFSFQRFVCFSFNYCIFIFTLVAICFKT